MSRVSKHAFDHDPSIMQLVGQGDIVDTVACNRLTAKFMKSQDSVDAMAAINRALLNITGSHKDTDMVPSLPIRRQERCPLVVGGV